MKRRKKYFKVRKGKFLLNSFENNKAIRRKLKRHNIFLEEQMLKDLMKRSYKIVRINGSTFTLRFKKENKFPGGSISLQKVIIEDKEYFKLNYFSITTRSRFQANDKVNRYCILQYGP